MDIDVVDYIKLLDIVKSDSEFLARQGIMDYSMLLIQEKKSRFNARDEHRN